MVAKTIAAKANPQNRHSMRKKEEKKKTNKMHKD
jgi:hypothetical protein